MSYLYDWQNNFSDDPRFCGKAPLSNVIGEPSVMSVSVNGLRLKNPGSVCVVKSGEKGFVVTAAENDTKETKKTCDFRTFDPPFYPYHTNLQELLCCAILYGKVVIEFGGQP